MALVLCRLRLSYSKTQVLRAMFSSQPEQKSKIKAGKVVNVSIIGSPNSGKSTLINNIIERKVCAASNKVHTTRKLARAMCYQGDTQIVFLDTPGMVSTVEKKKYNLPDSMLEACYKSLRCADVIGVVHDISNRYTKDCIHRDLMNILTVINSVPSFLIINKIDQIKSKSELLFIIRNLTNGYIAGNPMPGIKEKESSKKNGILKGYSHFSDVFLVSALKGDGVQDVKEYLISNAKPANYQYPVSNWTDQAPEQLIEEAVRAKFLDFLAQEIPYKLITYLDYYEEDAENDKILCSVTVECPSERLMRLISGAGGGRLQQIKSYVRNDLMDMFKKTVVIDLHLKVKDKQGE